MLAITLIASVKLGALDEACAETLSLSSVQLLRLAILEFLDLGLMLLNKLLILMSFLDTRILLILWSLAHDTSGFHDIIVDVPSDVLVHCLDLLHL